MSKEETYVPVDEVAEHWFCHDCHAHFSAPMKKLSNNLWVCPACKSTQVEFYKKGRV